MAGVSSNPNSPRQKMINLMYLVFIAMMALNVSSEVLDGFALVEGSLQTSLDNTSERNKMYSNVLSKEFAENQDKVRQWYTRGLEVNESSDDLYDYIQDLKGRIVKQADGKNGDIHNIKHQDDLEAASRIMLSPINGQGKVLRGKIDEYRESLKPLVSEDIRGILDVSLNTEAPKKAGLNIRTWENALFENMPVAAAITLLTKLQNDIRYSQGEVLSYLLKSIDAQDYRVNQLQAQVIPASQIIMQGSPYEGQIVLSAVDSTQRPAIYIGDQVLPDENRGFYSITPPGVGEQVFRGRMKTADGAEHEFESRYYVTERMAAVSPLKMNVLYAEYDNDLSIAVPGVTNERVTASITNGTLTKRGNVWIARPNRGATTATVTVNAAGGTIPYQFRVLPLPEPIPYIQYTDANGDIRKFKGGTLAKRTLVETDQILAGYDDGLLDVNFTVTEFVMYHYDSFGNTISLVSNSGRLTDQQKNTIRNFSRGQRFYISRVKARADGQQEAIPLNFPLEVTVN